MKNKTAYSPDGYFEKLYTVCPSPFEKVESREDFEKTAAEIKGKLKDILAVEKIPFKLDEPSVKKIKAEKRNGYTVETLSVGICRELDMLCYVLLPEKRTEKGVVALCGHGYGARQIIRQGKNGKYRKINFLDNYQKNFAEAMALDGSTVIVPEFIGFGEARLKKDLHKPFYASSCDTVSHHSLLYGFSAASLRVYQATVCVGLLEKLYGCEKTGCMGISGGGLVALYTACMDERIDKVCVCGYINTFKTSILSRWHCPDNYIPGIMNVGEMYDFACALAPRRLMMECGKKDKLFLLSGSEKAISRISDAYRIAQARDNFIPVVFDGKHEVSLEQALGFFK